MSKYLVNEKVQVVQGFYDTLWIPTFQWDIYFTFLNCAM